MRHLFRSRFAMALLLVLLTAIAGVVGWARKGGNSTDQPRIENQTRALIVESVAELETSQRQPQNKRRTFKLIVRNGYSQPLVAFSLRQQDSGVGEGSVAGMETNGATNGWVLPPNGTETTFFGAPAEGEVVITLAAVLLADGTGDGDFQALSRLREVSSGVKMAYQQILPLLRREANSTEGVAPEIAVQSLEDQIAAISEEKDVPPNLRRGFHEGKEFLINDLKELETKLRSGQNLQHRWEIAKMTARVEEILSKLNVVAPF
jgi:hypothetical protein